MRNPLYSISLNADRPLSNQQPVSLHVFPPVRYGQADRDLIPV
jgi:hypothetical protein